MSVTRIYIHNPALLHLLRGVAWAVVAASVWLIVTNIPLFYQFVLERMDMSEGLRRLQVDAHAVALVRTVVRRFSELCYIGLSAAILLRSRDLMAILIAMTLAPLGASISGSYIEVAAARPDLVVPTSVVAMLSTTLSALLVFTLPDGKMVPRWGRWLLVVFVLAEAVRIAVLSTLVPNAPSLVWTLTFVPFGATFMIGLNGQRMRYATLSPVVQHQFKWVVYGAVVAVVAVLIGQVSYLVVPRDYVILTAGIDEVGGLVLALCWIFATTRSRLYDINLYIHRTLLYSVIAAALLVAFGLGWLALHALLAGNLGETATLIVVSLLVGLLFDPVRRRAVAWVDRGLYGFRFDLHQLAAGTLSPQVSTPGAYTGRSIAGFALLELIGQGGMGEVYRGYAFGRQVAVKLLPSTVVHEMGHTFRDRLENEARSLSQLDHPNIVRLYDYGEDPNGFYIVMEYIQGPSLRERLRDAQRLPLDEVTAIITDVAAALDEVHGSGLIHRDLKPSNIVLKPSAQGTRAILIDFGVALITSRSTTITGTNAVGTIDYMAPEQIKEASVIDRRADVYALGVMTYEMLTGEKPFTGTMAQILFAHVYEPAPDPLLSDPGIPPEAALAVRRAMSKDPEDRYPSAGAFAEALKAVPVAMMG